MNINSLLIGLLGIVFITLKLIGVIDWSWWWVTTPFWIPAGIGASIVIFFSVLVLLIHTIEFSIKIIEKMGKK